MSFLILIIIDGVNFGYKNFCKPLFLPFLSKILINFKDLILFITIIKHILNFYNKKLSKINFFF